MLLPNLKTVACFIPVPEIIATGILGGVCEPPIFGKGSRRGSGNRNGTVRKSVG